ncbi:MAG: efflux RND transporter periplasmic adaptor subunit, partial [Oscillospiraceae bacterium]|nr:efflux RND transporter periplasmic adaptor subunit [Oscillospiraceae bacterium]
MKKPDIFKRKQKAAETAAPETDTELTAKTEDSSDTPTYVPGKKKKGRIIKWIILILIVAAVIFFIVRSKMASNAPMQVETMDVTRGDIEETVTISGTVTAAESKTFYAGMTATINSVPVKAGDRIQKGDLLLDYDKDELELTR